MLAFSDSNVTGWMISLSGFYYTSYVNIFCTKWSKGTGKVRPRKDYEVQRGSRIIALLFL